jgi:hypothetical protein
MSVRYWWNNTDRGEWKYMIEKLFQCHFVHMKYHMDWPGFRPRPLSAEAAV